MMFYILLYQFPLPAVTNYHRTGSLKQQKSFPSQFQRPKAKNYCQAKIKVLIVLYQLQRHWGESISCLFQLRVGASIAWLATTFTPIFAFGHIAFLFSVCQIFLCFPITVTFVITFRIIQDSPFISRFLVYSQQYTYFFYCHKR